MQDSLLNELMSYEGYFTYPELNIGELVAVRTICDECLNCCDVTSTCLSHKLSGTRFRSHQRRIDAFKLAAGSIGNAFGELRCKIDCMQQDPRFEFYSIQNGRLWRTDGALSRGEINEMRVPYGESESDSCSSEELLQENVYYDCNFNLNEGVSLSKDQILSIEGILKQISFPAYVTDSCVENHTGRDLYTYFGHNERINAFAQIAEIIGDSDDALSCTINCLGIDPRFEFYTIRSGKLWLQNGTIVRTEARAV